MNHHIQEAELSWFHRYPARFSIDALQHVMKGICDTRGKIPKNILDPFAGTGSSLSFAKQHGITSYGKELTPLGCLICNVRLNPPIHLDKITLLAQDIIGESINGDCDNVDRELVGWIGEDNAATLDHILSIIENIDDQRSRNFLTLALSSALRPSSYWLPGSIKPQIDRNRGFSDLKANFLYFSKKLKQDCEREKTMFDRECDSTVIQGDSKVLEFKDEKFESLITSPPYFSMYDYFDVHRLSYLAFRWEKQCELQIGRKKGIENDGVGFEPPASMKIWYRNDYDGENTYNGRSLREYFQSMEQHLSEAYRVLKFNGVAAYAVANSTRKGKKFSLVTAIADQMRNAGFTKISIRSRKQTNRRILPAGRNLLTGRFDSKCKPTINEFIIYAIKT